MSSITGAAGTICEGASVTLHTTASGVTPGSFVEWYIGPNSSYNPYTGQGVHIGEVPIEITCNNAPAVLYIMVNPDNVQAGGPGDECDEFMVLWTGSGGFNTSDILVTNLSNGAAMWDNFVTGNAATFSCGTALPPGPVPPNAILIIQSHTTNNINVDISTLCASGLPVYIIAYGGTVSCAGGYFDNDSPCASCPVMISIGGTCPANINLNYAPPAVSTSGWGWSNMGSGVFADVVPPVNIPAYVPDEIIVDDFVWTVPNDFCETMAGGNWFITGILEPPPTGACPDIFTQYFLVDISCPELDISGGGDVCLGNCPGNPTEITFDIIGNDVPFTANLIVSISGFPQFPINNLQISDGQKIFVCMGGFFPAFDPNTGILTVPVLAVGVTATVTVTSLTSAAGCPVTNNPNSVTLTFIDAPSADAGGDVVVCAGEDAMLNGSIGGSASDGIWSTGGDGTFSDPSDLSSTYTPGPQDILDGSVVLTLSSMDPNGSCTPATSTMTVLITPAINIDLGPAQTVCDNDVVNLIAMMTGGTVTGEWLSSGDGTFDDPNNVMTFYTPGPNDFNIGFVTISFDVTDPNACIGVNNPLNVVFVHAAQVTLPQNLEVCEGEVANIQINIAGAFTNVNWSVIGDGQLSIISQTQVNYTPGPGDIIMGSAIVSVTIGSPFMECGVTTYNIPVMIITCNCPPFETSPPGSPLCSISDQLDLSTLFVVGDIGAWSITNTPIGSNPAILVGNIFTTSSSDPGIYTVTYTLDNPTAGCPFTSSEMIQVLSVINPDAGPDFFNCGPGVVALIGTPAPTPPVSILWATSGDGIFSNATSQATIYTPGSLDSISPVIFIAYNVIDPICGNQSDTMEVHFNQTPFASFANDTFDICNETDKGSIINFPSLISGGDVNGIWSNIGGAPVNFSNPSSVDFNGIAVGFYTFSYQTNSAVAPCQNVSYTIVISVKACLCPSISVQPLPGGICNSQQILALNAFVMAGAPGNWTILSAPPGTNPATVIGSDMQIQGADPGLYSLRFTFDSAPIVACPDSAEIQVLIQDAPTLSISSDTSICGQADIPLNAIVGGSATNAIWFTSGSGTFDQSQNLNPTYSPSNADILSGQIRIIAKTSDTLGFCTDVLDTMFINFSTQPFVTWSSLMDTVCNQSDSGSVVNLLSFITSGDLSGLWTDEDGANVNLSNPANVDFDGVSSGIYHFKYETQNAIPPCVNIDYTFQVLVEDCACPLLEISDIVNTVCIPTSIDLNALIVNAAPGSWSVISGPFGTWPIITANTVITDNADEGQYVLQYLLTDSVAGCSASKFVSFSLESSPVVSSTSVDCDPDLLHYSVVINTNASMLTSDFGVVTLSGPGVYNIQSIAAGQNIVLQLSSASGDCMTTVPFSAPDCNCTLMIEDIADTLFLCKGDTFTLIPIVTGATGLPFNFWTGPHGTVQKPSFKIFEDGTFIWAVKDSLCERRDTFNVKVYDSVLLNASFLPPFCPGGNDGMIVINSITQGSEPYSVQLDNGTPFLVSTFPDTIKLVSSGNHMLSITDLQGCESQFTVTVPNPSDRDISLGPDIIITKGDSVLINPVLTNIAVQNFMWNADSFNLNLLPKWIIPDATTTLSLTVTDSSGCIFQDDLNITVTTKQDFYIPTVFSPNGDGINDFLIVETSANPIDIRTLEIFDRWGNLVYLQNDSPPFSWNGTFKNHPVSPGVYIVKLKWKDENGDDQFYFTDITLIR
ncbi:MAG: gliding motility-associated C-terminal domain-containing protein [Saprospiraceae bacterium]|uniref:Gliding motility-associated C-terminal domain-containing protein n=1 Tax=Candidatus Opimibacter skivensis TaxID=2982028 RepID=A0A9D7XLI1_9BACT|nr:gliding motility-associated C-terminal domain-containing protein [Candidatus Opimibacter skivensis]